jgi:hypothetical protein
MTTTEAIKILRAKATQTSTSPEGLRLHDAITTVCDALKRRTSRGPRYRSAIWGHFVTEEYAAAHPKTTVREGNE